MSLPAGQAAAGGADPRCIKCRKPFGFVAAYCPFCGFSQQVLSPPMPAPAAQLPRRPASQTPTSVPPGPFPAATPAPRPVPPAAGRPPPRAGKPARPAWAWGVAILLVIVAIKACTPLLRHGPMASLTVSVRPYVTGAVTIDGRRAGHPGDHLQVTAGTHSLGFAGNGWLAAPRTVSLQANQRQAVLLELAPQPSVLVISRTPADAILRLDNRVIDTNRSEFSVSPGRHRLVAAHAGYLPLTLELTLMRGERRTVAVALVKPVVTVVTLQAPVGNWSEPVTLPPRTDFTLALNGRVRLRIGREVYLVESGRSINLGDVRGAALQVKAVDDQPVDVRLFLTQER